MQFLLAVIVGGFSLEILVLLRVNFLFVRASIENIGFD